MQAINYKLEDDVISVLKASSITDNKLFLPQNLERKLYVKTNKALERRLIYEERSRANETTEFARSNQLEWGHSSWRRCQFS
jgi:hypothetical protein